MVEYRILTKWYQSPFGSSTIDAQLESQIHRLMASSGQQKCRFLREREERSILVKIRFKLYEISTEVLLEVFSTCGNIETLENFKSGEEFHSRVCFEDKDSAIRALDWYNGRCIYGLWCELELFQGFQVTDRKTKVPVQETKEVPTESDDAQLIRHSPRCFDQKFEVFSDIVLGEEFDLLSEEREGSPIEGDDRPIIQESPRSVRWETEAPWDSTAGNSGEEFVGDGEYASKLGNTEEITNPVDELNGEIEEISEDNLAQSRPSKDDELKESSNSENGANKETHPIQVTPNPCEVMECDGALKGLGELVVLLIQLMEIRIANSRMSSFDYLRFLSAHQVFVKMPKKGVHVLAGLRVDEWPSNLVSFGIELEHNALTMPYDRGKRCFYNVNGNVQMLVVRMDENWFKISDWKSLPFDRGGVHAISIEGWPANSGIDGSVRFVFDPGIIEWMIYLGKFSVAVTSS